MSSGSRVIVITGGAGHLGRAIAEGVLADGGIAVLLDRDARTIEDWAQGREDEDRIAGFACDLASEAARAETVKAICDRFDRVDALVNNAAFVGDSNLSGWVVPFAEQSIATWRAALEVNLTAPFHLAQLLHEALRRSENGGIVNIASLYGIVGPDMSLYEGTGMGNPAAYAASKGGLIQLTRWMATVLAPDIRVNAVSPGGLSRGQPESFRTRYEAKTPLGRMGREEDIVGAVQYLCSPAARWVTGQNIVVDGGFSAW